MSDAKRWYRSKGAWIEQDLAEAIMRQKVTHAEVSVWLCLWDHVNRDTGTAWPGVPTISEVTGLNRRTVQRALRQLEDLGHVKTEPREGGEFGNQTNLYTLVQGGGVQTAGGRPVDQGGGGADTAQTKTNEPKKNPLPPKGDYELEGFAEAWSLWRKGSAKKAAGRAWKAALKKKTSADLLSSMARWLQANRDTETRYLPALAVWLNGERWDDEVSPAEGGSAWKLR